MAGGGPKTFSKQFLIARCRNAMLETTFENARGRGCGSGTPGSARRSVARPAARGAPAGRVRAGLHRAGFWRPRWPAGIGPRARRRAPVRGHPRRVEAGSPRAVAEDPHRHGRLSARAVAKRMGVSTATLYRHVGPPAASVRIFAVAAGPRCLPHRAPCWIKGLRRRGIATGRHPAAAMPPLGSARFTTASGMEG